MNQTNHVCVIFAAGQYYGPTPGVPADLLAGLSRPLVIAADAGLDHARAEGVSADIVIGDFDSVQGSVPDDDRTLRLPALKDDPDMLSALKVGWNRGAREFHILGGLGGESTILLPTSSSWVCWPSMAASASCMATAPSSPP
jgi:thiamine pyrophosphokinase